MHLSFLLFIIVLVVVALFVSGFLYRHRRGKDK
jgi:uncharacterized SAM-binding protein YcdF (DUF218 family)